MTTYESRPYGAASKSPAKATSPILAAALAYAKAGVSVFPCSPGQKTPLTSSGFQDATTDSRRIERWWRYWPDANVAMPTGVGSFDVLDVDVRPGGNGWAAFERLETSGLLVGATRVVSTPSTGLHVYFSGTTQRSSQLRGQFIDFKASGGYVLLPPSSVQTEAYLGEYRLLEKGPKGPPLDWQAVTRLIGAPTSPSPAPVPERPVGHVGGLVKTVAGLTPGNRNSGFFWACCRALEAGHGLDELAEAVRAIGLTETEIASTMASALRTVGGGLS